MKIKINESDITAAYKVDKKPENGKPLHIVVKFGDLTTRNNIFRKETLFKVIKLDLTLPGLNV